MGTSQSNTSTGSSAEPGCQIQGPKSGNTVHVLPVFVKLDDFGNLDIHQTEDNVIGFLRFQFGTVSNSSICRQMAFLLSNLLLLALHVIQEKHNPTEGLPRFVSLPESSSIYEQFQKEVRKSPPADLSKDEAAKETAWQATAGKVAKALKQGFYSTPAELQAAGTDIQKLQNSLYRTSLSELTDNRMWAVTHTNFAELGKITADVYTVVFQISSPELHIIRTLCNVLCNGPGTNEQNITAINGSQIFEDQEKKVLVRCLQSTNESVTAFLELLKQTGKVDSMSSKLTAKHWKTSLEGKAPDDNKVYNIELVHAAAIGYEAYTTKQGNVWRTINPVQTTTLQPGETYDYASKLSATKLKQSWTDMPTDVLRGIGNFARRGALPGGGQSRALQGTALAGVAAATGVGAALLWKNYGKRIREKTAAILNRSKDKHKFVTNELSTITPELVAIQDAALILKDKLDNQQGKKMSKAEAKEHEQLVEQFVQHVIDKLGDATKKMSRLAESEDKAADAIDIDFDSVSASDSEKAESVKSESINTDLSSQNSSENSSSSDSSFTSDVNSLSDTESDQSTPPASPQPKKTSRKKGKAAGK